MINDNFQNTLKEIYETADNRPNGTEWEYRGYTFIKSDATLTTWHSEVQLYNPEMNKVECYSISVFEDWKSFAERVFEIIEYSPDDLHDWLNRDNFDER